MKTTLFLLAAQWIAGPSELPTTFCNPISLPNIPESHLLRTFHAEGRPHRQYCDPALLRDNGKWYLYPSSGFAWVSSNDGGTWESLANPSNFCGHAPAIARLGDRYLYVEGTDAVIYSAAHPEGPFQRLGTIAIDYAGGVLPPHDPDLFVDGEHLYFYWGCSETGGIWGCELDASDPTHPLTKPKELICFDPIKQPWERHVPNPSVGWVEGAWMVKIDGRYFLTYSAAGAEHKEYAMGAYISSEPLGEFVPQKNNPFLRKTDGLLTGVGHGAVVKDEKGALWVGYCVHVGSAYKFERYAGFDRLALDPNGEIAVTSVTTEPQYLPSFGTGPTGWKAIPGMCDEPEATDLSLQTAAPPKELPRTVNFTFAQPALVRAQRLVWRECGYDPEHGVQAGPIRYRVEVRSEGEWKTLLDASANDRDLLVDYRETPPLLADAARLTILSAPAGISPAVAEWTLFGTRKAEKR